MNKKLTDWIESKGITLIPDKIDLFDRYTKTIKYNKHNKKENQLFSILHECGHFLLQQNIYTYAKKYKAQVDFNTRLFDKPFRPYKISVLKEEYDAWDRGLALAKRLKIDIDEEKYYNYASKFLYTYCKWVVSRRRNV
jgi:hypothetical protein